MRIFCFALVCLSVTGWAEDYSSLDRKSFVQFMKPSHVEEILSLLPEVEGSPINQLMRDKNTMWYDEESMVFVYQDSVESVVGLRANQVGREVGERSNVPDIKLLMDFFGPDKKFRFPFRSAAGTDESQNVRVVNFWIPAKKGSQVLPVKWWKTSTRGRWRWIHPEGTVFGEVLMIEDSSGSPFVFEIRTRERYSHGWGVDLFRPFQNSAQLVRAIKSKKENWKEVPELKRIVNHLKDASTLSSSQLIAPEFHLSWKAVQGGIDVLPDFEDETFVKKLLTEVPFKTIQGRVWRENAQYETYAPSTKAKFSIVPQNYQMGVIPVNEVSCGRCHDQTGRGLGDFEDKVVLYGEIWGEDHAFTWHPFEVNPHIYSTWDDSDGSRFINPRLVQAGLLSEGKPNVQDIEYKGLKTWPLPN